MDEDIKKLLEKNLEISQEILKTTKKIKTYINFQKVMSIIYFLIIVVPIVLSFIFLPPLIKQYLGPYEELLGINQSADNALNSMVESGKVNINKINELIPKN